MANQYFILIEKESEKYFRLLKRENYNDNTRDILKRNNSSGLWSMPEGHIDKNIWKNIQKNDLVFLGNSNEQIPYVGKVITKKAKRYSAKVFDLYDLDAQQRNHFLFIEKMDVKKLSFIDLIQRCEFPNRAEKIPGIYKLKRNVDFESNIQSDKKESSKPKIKFSPKPFNWDTTPTEPKGKSKKEVFRYIRDPLIVKDLKKLYDNKCQICGLKIKVSKNEYYCEVHHYKPLHEKGKDYKNNMIVLCPNHHTMFDFKTMKIDYDLKTILNENGTPIPQAKITFKHNHSLDIENIKSQL